MGLVDFSERITILTANEIEEIYRVPTFSDQERELYFAMDAKEQKVFRLRRHAGIPLTKGVP